MPFVIFLYAVSLIYSILIILIALGVFRSKFKRQKERYEPFVSVIIPVKGISNVFSEFLDSIKRQDYKKSEYLFCLADKDDPAINAIRGALKDTPYRILISEPDSVSYGKNQNMITGVGYAAEKTDILAFIDADGYLCQNYVYSLVEPLQDLRYLCSSAYRLYNASCFGGLLEKYWNCLGMLLQNFPLLTRVAGCGFAIRRGDLQLLDIPQIWKNHINDDLPLTSKIRSLKGRVFSVRRYALSSSEDSFSEAVAWVSREHFFMYSADRLTYYYYMSVFSIPFLFTVIYLIHHHLLLLLPLVSSFVMLCILCYRYGTPKEWLLFPFIFLGTIFLTALSFIMPPFMKRIEWAGITYTIDKRGRIIKKSPQDDK